MDFFDSFPEPPPPPERPPAPPRPSWMRPVATLPAALAENAIIVRDDRLAIGIGGLSVYPNGFDFTLHIRSRSEDAQIDPFGRRRYRDYARNTTVKRDPEDPSQSLRVGVLFADGRRAASNHARPQFGLNAERDPDKVVLQSGSGSGGPTYWNMSFWVHPLPPEGPMTIIISWLAQDIAEARHDIDGAAIRAAAAQAVQLWPEEPPLTGWVGTAG